MGDVERRTFLRALVTALADDRWVVGYAEVKTFGVIGATLRREGVDGYVQIVPSVVNQGSVSWRDFPHGGVPHYDIKIDGGGLRTCVVADAVAILERWAASKLPSVSRPIEPMLPTMQPILEAIAAAPLPELDDAIDQAVWPLTPEGQAQLAQALAVVDRAAIVRAFPRDDNGRVTATRAILAPLGTSKRHSVYLAVQAVRARGNDRLELAIVDANEISETYRWTDAPWLWRTGATAPEDDARAAECLALLDAGEFDAALAMYGVTLTDKARRILDGIPRVGNAHHDADRDALRRLLWSAAVWKLPALRYGNLALLPHQRGQIKGWIAWHPPAIDIEGTTSNARLPRCDWARSIDSDLARLGIASKPAAATKKKPPKAKPAKALKPLAEMIAGKDLWQATTAVKHAKLRPPADARAELFAIVDSIAPTTERANALWVALEIAEAADGAAFARYLDDGGAHVRRVAVDGVKKLGYQPAIPALARIVCGGRDRTSYEDMHAATAMKVMSGTNGPSGLVRYFASDDPRVREAACRAFEIFHQGKDLSRPHLEKALLDEDAAVRAAAQATLEAQAKR